MNKRNLNLDVLRILAMLMIISLHTIVHSKLFYSTSDMSIHILSLFLYYLVIIGVNIFVLISGYFLVDKEFSWKKFFRIAIEVWFYSIFILLLSFIFNFNLSVKEILFSIFPITLKQYWFVPVYLLLYVISPYLNILIKYMNKKEHFTLLSLLIIIFTCYNALTHTFDSSQGFGIIWFIILYLTSAYIKKYIPLNTSKKYKIKCSLICILSAILMTTSYLIAFKVFGRNISRLRSYDNVVVFIQSLCMFMIFRNLNIKFNQKISKGIGLLSKATFGVYLIHDNLIISTRLFHIINDDFYVKNGLFVFILLYISIILSIYVICTIIEIIRMKIFKRVENSKIFKKIGQKISTKWQKIMKSKFLVKFQNI